jgi:ABC-type multidrug transport system fused ATPase/permease subunit
MSPATGDKPLPLGRILKDLLFYSSRSVKVGFIVRVLAALGSVGVELAFAFGMQLFLVALGLVTASSLELPSWAITDSVLWLSIGLVVLGGFRALLLMADHYLAVGVAEEFKTDIRQKLMWGAFHSSDSSSHEYANYFGEVTNKAGSFVLFFTQLINSSTLAICLFLSLFTISLPLALTTLLLLPVFWLPTRFINRRIRSEGGASVIAWERLNRRLILGIRNLLFLRLHGLEEDERQLASITLKKAMKHYRVGQFFSSTMVAYPNFIGVALIAGLTVMAQTFSWATGGLLLAFFYLLFRSLQNVSQLSYQYAQLVYYAPNFQSLKTFLEDSMAPKIRIRSRSAEDKSFGTSIGWRLEKVSFRYNEKSPWIFKELDFQIEAGEVVILMGGSGVGKSTLLSILLGEKEVSSGKISISANGQTLSLDKHQGSLLASIGYVGPEPFLVEGSVRENLSFGRQQVYTDDQMRYALNLAGAQFIYEMPGGLDWRITDQGQGLSAGQKQRISLARALLRSPRAIFLDEATANLDESTESEIIDSILGLKGQLTVIVVTHRNSMLRLGGRVYLLKDGQLLDHASQIHPSSSHKEAIP